MMINDWKHTNSMDYFYRKEDGRVLGAVWHKALDSSVWTSKIYTEDFPFTNESEKFLGHFIDEYSAKKSVELFWLKEYNTLITSN